MNPRERQWRRRNPELAVKFDRLPKAAQANIRTAFLAPIARGVSAIVRQADAQRREAVAARSSRRRLVQRYADQLAALPTSERRNPANRPVDLTPSEERAMWARYDKRMGNGLHGR